MRRASDAAVGRDEFVETFNRRGVGCGIYYPKVVFDYGTNAAVMRTCARLDWLPNHTIPTTHLVRAGLLAYRRR